MSEKLEDSEVMSPDWEKDAKVCNGCQREFTFRRRRHHCRACGQTFCGTCSKHKDTLPPQYELEGPQRTCDECHRHLKKLAMAENPDDHPPLPDPSEIRAGLLGRLQKVACEPEESWVNKVNKKGIVIDVLKIHESSVFCVRSKMKIKAKLEKVVGIYNNKDLWKKWQPELVKCTSLEAISPNEEFMYVLYKIPVLDKRELVCYSSICEGSFENQDSSDERCIISTSVLHPLVGPTKGVVRALLSFGYTRFHQEGDETAITSLYHTDPRGMIPPQLVNSTITRAADQLRQMVEFMETADFPIPDTLAGTGNPLIAKEEAKQEDAVAEEVVADTEKKVNSVTL